MRNPSSALDLTELYRMPAMNLQPNYFHSGPSQNQNQNQNQNTRMPPAQFQQGLRILASSCKVLKNLSKSEQGLSRARAAV